MSFQSENFCRARNIQRARPLLRDAAHDLAGRVRTSKDANGVTTEFTYYPRGWLLTRTVKGATVGRLDQQLQRRNDDPRLD